VVASLVVAGVLAGCGDDAAPERERPAATGRAAAQDPLETRVARSTVALTAQIGEDVVTSSGVVLDADRGLVLTSAHTVWGARSLKVTTELGTLHGRLVARAACDGLALVETHPRLPGLTPLRLAPEGARPERLVAFGWRFAVGRPQELAAQPVRAPEPVRDAVVDPALPRLESALALPFAVPPGASGGPLVDGEGRLAGLLQAEGRGGRAVALPVARIRDRLGELRPGPRRIYVGWEEQYACSDRLMRFAGARHAGFVRRDAALNAPVPASRLPGVGEVEPR